MFENNIRLKDFGTLKIKNKVIKNDYVWQEVRGKSLDTRTSKETFNEDFESILNHPKFEYDELAQSKPQRSKRNKKDRLRESIHNSTSPRLNRNANQNMQVKYETSNKTSRNVTYIPKEGSFENEEQIKDIIYRNDQSTKNLMKNQINKNHKSMLKLHEKGLKKVTSFIDKESASNKLFTQPQSNKFWIDRKNTQAVIPIQQYVVPEQPRLKNSKSKSRYDNQILSSSEKEDTSDDNKFKRNVSHNSRQKLGDYTEIAQKRYYEDPEVIKSLAKDNYNPFLLNALEHAKQTKDNSERIANKMYSRIAQQITDKSEKSNTMNMKEQIEILQNDRIKRSKITKNQTKTSTPNVDHTRRNELDVICEEYGTKNDLPDPEFKENMVYLKDVQKDYKSSEANLKTQFNRYQSNKNLKAAPRKIKPSEKHKENENTMNDVSYKREKHKLKPKKPKVKQHKKSKHKSNHSFEI